jgi:CPA1 family monovalent cation:H+ antiporter
MMLDKKAFWAQKGTILNMAVALVIFTVVSIGYFAHLLIPVISLSCAFMLVASLGPTDDVAILSVSQRVSIPPKLMNILTGESIINDATGIVCFQLALAAIVSGSFSPGQAVVQLFIIGLGGILTGLLFTGAKYLFVKWIRRLGMESTTLHILIEILTPFLVYLLAEKLEVSGILAVFTAGVTHSLGKKTLNPEMANLNVASKNIWNVLSFTLEGIVYLILGTQLPHILKTVQSDTNPVSAWSLVLYVLAITLIFAVSRFIWFYLTARRESYSDSSNTVGKFKTGLIFSLSGARGAVTMASVLSIPVLLSDGTSFPQRDMIILLATGIILCSLCISNFILPLVVGKPNATDLKTKENEAYLDILNSVVTALKKTVTGQNQVAVRMILSQYHSRIKEAQIKVDTVHIDRKKEKKLFIQAWKWEKENTDKMIENNEIDEHVGLHYINALGRRIGRESGTGNPFGSLNAGFRAKRNAKQLRRNMLNNKEHRTLLLKLKEDNSRYVICKLKELQLTDNCAELKKILSDYESFLLFVQNMISGVDRMQNSEIIEDEIIEVATIAFQMERDNIQAMFESGHISREKAKELRDNIALLETELLK